MGGVIASRRSSHFAAGRHSVDRRDVEPARRNYPIVDFGVLAIRYLEWVAGDGFKDGKSR
jgi:hypothetical protein